MDFYRINEDYNRYLQNYEKEIKGSLRFNYMIPVPEECIERLVIKDVKDEKYRMLLNKEYQFCMDNKERIQKKFLINLFESQILIHKNKTYFGSYPHLHCALIHSLAYYRDPSLASAFNDQADPGPM